VKIEVIEDADDDVKRELISSVREFNAAVLGHADSKPLTVVARDAEGRLIGGVSGRTIHGHYLIEVVWVAESERSAGLGRELMNEAEKQARQRGCYGAQVDTTSFQAPGFYEKLGFRTIGTVEDFPPGHKRHFMQKDYG
jgi:ribosomal protein S18 acetylase RimI-like enzyme